MPDLIPIMLGVVFAVLVSTVGDLFIASGMRKVGALSWQGFSAIPGQIASIAKTPQIPLGVACMAVFFSTWLGLLSRADLSLILPMTALTYVLNGLAAEPVLGEKVSRQRWVGILVITVGVILVTVTGEGHTK